MGQQRYEKYKDTKIALAVEELDGYRMRKQQILRLKERRLHLEDEMESIKAMRYDIVRVQGGKMKDAVIEMIVEWAEVGDKIEKLILDNEREMNLIEEKIQRLKADEQQVIVFYYVNGKSVNETAAQMHLSFEGLKKLKKRALRAYADVTL